MITLSNGHQLQYVVASGALAFDGLGWPWEWPLRWVGLIDPKLFTIVTKTLTLKPRRGNLRWYKPWSCVKLLPGGGALNKIGLTNAGFDWWCETVAPKVAKSGLKIVVSISGDWEELMEMAHLLDDFPNLAGIEVNPSCPNTSHGVLTTEDVIRGAVKSAQCTSHPFILKLSAAQDYLAIARELRNYPFIQAISLNSVPWKKLYPNTPSPFDSLPGDGGGGVSGKPAQELNWKAVRELAQAVPSIPVIAPSIMEYGDLAKVDALGAKAYSFGAIHLRTPWKPTQIVKRHIAETKAYTA